MKQIFYLIFSCIYTSVAAQGGSFTFTLERAATTSAGVYTKDGQLVRTLWNDVKYPAGKHSEEWDGRDDIGNLLGSGDEHSVKLVSNNVQYTWEGTLGNSSDAMTGAMKHRGYYHCMRGLAFSGSFGYFCTGYSEGSPSLAKFAIAKPNQKLPIMKPGIQTGDINYVAADDKMVYWGAFDANVNGNSFVFATRVQDDQEVPFAGGTSYTVKYGKTYAHSVSLLKGVKAPITGLAVQQKGNLLLVARAAINEIQVIHKKTGALLARLTVPAPRHLSFDQYENLWMISGLNTVASYTIDADRKLSEPVVSLSGLEDPVVVQASLKTNTVSVADGGKSQQVKFFDLSSGKLLQTLGIAGGYFTDPSVTDNKFYFNDLIGKKLTFIAYEPNGSFWVGDPGNYRAQHYDKDNKFIGRIMSLGASYSVWADKNNIRRVWADYLEFEVDYTAPLSGKSGWTLVRNWGANVGIAYNKSEKFRFITTLANGRTYGFLRRKEGREIVEFPDKGPLRFSGIVRSGGLNFVLASDGSLQSYSKGVVGGKSHVLKFELAGFDPAGNPLWSTLPQTLATTPPLTDDDPNAYPRGEMQTSTGKLIIYAPGTVRQYTDRKPVSWLTGYHLGALEPKNERWLWRTELATNRRYKGDFPKAGFFDIGNNVNDFAGGSLCIVDRNVITSYHGEFWKNAQTNKFNHYLDNGLAIAQFGITRSEAPGHAHAEMAGNALTPTLVKDANGDLYLYHGDESDHSGIHRWKISGLNTIRELDIKLQPVSPVASRQASASRSIHLMEGLVYDQVMENDSTGGWRRFPDHDITVDPYKDYFTVHTNVLSYDRLVNPDLFVKFAKKEAVTYTVSRDLAGLKLGKEWHLSGLVAYPGNMPNGQSTFQYLEVLDKNDKIIASFYVQMNRDTKPFSAEILGNKRLIASGEEFKIRKLMDRFTPLKIEGANGMIRFTYGKNKPLLVPVYNVAADWRTPKTLRCRFESLGSGAVYGSTLGLKDFIFRWE